MQNWIEFIQILITKICLVKKFAFFQKIIINWSCVVMKYLCTTSNHMQCIAECFVNIILYAVFLERQRDVFDATYAITVYKCRDSILSRGYILYSTASSSFLKHTEHQMILKQRNICRHWLMGDKKKNVQVIAIMMTQNLHFELKCFAFLSKITNVNYSTSKCKNICFVQMMSFNQWILCIS